MLFSIGVDIGGTFTDAVAINEAAELFVGKADTTPRDYSEGVVNALIEAARQAGISLHDLLSQTVFFGHGTTVGSNALVTRRGAKVGLVITKGFEDTPFIQRAVGRLAGLSEMQIRNQVALRQPEFLIPKKLVAGVTERVDCFGRVVVPLDAVAAKQAVKRLLSEGVEAIAICLLWSFANNAHEQTIKALVQELAPGLMVTASSDLIPKLRENARVNSTVINCFTGNSVNKYLAELKKELAGRGLSARINIMQVYGGLADIDRVQPINTINSGPVGGVIGAQYFAKKIGLPNLITADVGGTTFDVSAIYNGEVQKAREYFGATGVLDRFEVLIPRVDIKCIGAGGGSIARFDAVSQTIKLGPDSAGSNPGPIFYDIGGTEPTLADAWLQLGWLNPEYFLGGRKKINVAKSAELVQSKLAQPMGMSEQQACAAVVEIANNTMADTIREYVVEKGYDPKDFAVLAFGGAGLLHATSYGRLLGIKRIILAQNASVFSALGIALSDIIHTYSRSIIMGEPFNRECLLEAIGEVEQKLREDLKAYENFVSGEAYSFSVDMKYAGQIHELSLSISKQDMVAGDLTQALRAQFSKRYEEIYGRGSGYEKGGVEIVAINGRAVGVVTRPEFAQQHPGGAGFRVRPKTERCVYLENRLQRLPIYDSLALGPGALMDGPAIIEYPNTTALVLEGQIANVDPLLNVHVCES